MSEILSGLAIGGYRSFGPVIQRMGPFSQLNLFVGPNNAGKSNILRLLHSHLGLFQRPQKAAFNSAAFIPETDRFIGPECKTTIGLAENQTRLNDVYDRVDPYFQKRLDQIRKCEPLVKGTNCFWFDCEFDWKNQTASPVDIVAQIETAAPIEASAWIGIVDGLGAHSSTNSASENIGAFLEYFNAFKSKKPRVVLIPATRHIEDRTWGISNIVGADVLQTLAQLQNPHPHEKDKKRTFSAVRDFVREVTGHSDATLEVSYDKSVLTVNIGDKSLPLSSLGTGIHEVVIFAVVTMVIDNEIICFEEPELHLHPVLQRKLLRYLSKTTNQYFITTHSAHLMDAAPATCFRVSLGDEQTSVVLAESPSDKWDICKDLGYRASDLMQANCVIWVEGPTDRLYLRHWIRAIAPDLQEGLDFSIMFYGGRLLCHLSAQDQEIDDFIALCRLNRNLAVLIDSDCSSIDDQINETKQRVVREFEKVGYAWVTSGREIENYIDCNLMQEAIDCVGAGQKIEVATGKYDKIIPSRSGTNPISIDKLKVARYVVDKEPDLNPLDLEERIQELVKFIKQANLFEDRP